MMNGYIEIESRGKEPYILTIFITKNQTTFVQENYNRLKKQDVKQDIVVLSADPINIPNNFVVKVNETYTHTLRISISIDQCLKEKWSGKYTHFFKLDGDVILGPEYIKYALSKNRAVFGSGPGSALLFRADYFNKILDKQYHPSYVDDERNKFPAVALGLIPRVWEPPWEWGEIKIPSWGVSATQSVNCGYDMYKMGYPFHIMILISIGFFKNQHRLDMGINSTVGYLFALFGKVEKYQYSELFSKRINIMYAKKIVDYITLLKFLSTG